MIKHVLRDGRVLESIENHVVTLNNKTVTAYELLAVNGRVENDNNSKEKSRVS